MQHINHIHVIENDTIICFVHIQAHTAHLPITRMACFKKRPRLAYQVTDGLADNYAALIGSHICRVSDCTRILETSHPTSTLLHLTGNKVTVIRQILLNRLNQRAAETNVPINISASETIISQKTQINLTISKSETDQRAGQLSCIRLCISETLPHDIVIEALTTKITKKKQKLSIATIRAQLDNFGLSGTRLVEKRLTTILSILSPQATLDELDQLLHKARGVFDVLDESSSVTSSTSNTSLASSTPSRPSHPVCVADN